VESTTHESRVATNRMLAYIANHLHEPISANDLARVAGYSRFHASRIFKRVTGMSQFEYIRRERLIAAAHALRSGKYKVLDIALDFVFDSHEGFTRAFSNGFGISPKKYANYRTPEGWHIPIRYLDRAHAPKENLMMNQTAVIFTQIVERPARKLILQRSRAADDYYAYATEIGSGENGASAAWDVLCGIKEALYEPVGLWLPENMCPDGTGSYAHGVEVAIDYRGVIPEGFDVIDLAPCKLIVFQGEPYNDDEFATAVDVCMKRISSFNPEVYGYRYALNISPRMQLAPEGWRGYIEMWPVESLR
jgi:AraC family transcriptional regulator